MTRRRNTSWYSNKRLRDLERVMHIAGGLFLLVYIYSPWGVSSTFTLVAQVVVFPLLVGSGFAIWQLPRVRRWLESRRAAFTPS